MPRVLGKFESWVFYLLVFAVPFETRVILHRWTRPFNEWTAGFVYGTDILVAILFLFWAVRYLCGERKVSSISYLVSNIKYKIQDTRYKILSSASFWLTGFFIVSALSVFNARIVGLSLYQLLKLAEFIGFYFYLRSAFRKVFSFQKILAVIIVSGLFQSVIAIAQYFKQGNLGLKLFGESPLSVNATGVAVFIADGVKYLRAYGTMPHPNVLAAWLFLAVFAFYNYYLYFYPKEKPYLGKFLLAGYPVLLLGLFFTFSRTIIGLWALGAAIRILLLFKISFRGFLAATKRYMVAVITATLITSVLFAALFWPQVRSRVLISAEEEAVTQRVFYNQIAGSVTTAHPILGVGIGQFVPQLMIKLKHWPSAIYQPVHNIYLLIASETGFVGLALFLLFLFFLFWGFVRRADFRKPYSFSFLIVVFSFLVMGLFDHFLWTLQQGSLIFWMTLALINLNPDLG